MKTILLIEDDTVLRENTVELLELSNYKVISASNGKIGVDKAKLALPDIIICDILMPKLDGYGVLNALAKNNNTKHIPFIFLSAKTERQDIRKGMNLGADDYITKPFSEDDLISAIESRLAKTAILKEKQEENLSNIKTNENKIKTLNDFKNYINDYGEEFKYNKDNIIYNEGEHSNYIYLITKGVVKCYKLDKLGKELTTALYKEDDLLGYLSFTDNIPYKETATAIKDVEMVGILKKDLKNLLETNHKITLELIELLTNNLTGVKEELLQMAYSSVNKKTATTILKFAEKLNRKPEDPIKISRSDLASVAGIATETLIRTMSDFKKQGLIAIEGRNIKILELQKLKDTY
ncbi:response regulator [Pontimicrobium sp. SW4]|uniref:Response regulator n=1 Tax=Pontimicrobium sp. SW4 TaxID=3153519 RepID=A0AAU7BW59_9FLAO